MKENLLQTKLSNTAIKWPDKVAVQCGKEKRTYQEIDELSNQLAMSLKSSGVKRGDRIMIQLGNTTETIIAFWAALKAEAIVSIIGEDVKDEKLIYLLKDSGAKVFFSQEDYVSTEYAVECNIALKQFYSWIELNSDNTIDSKQLNFEALSIDLASIIYTSGSTGEPKGVMLTHLNMLTAEDSINGYLHYNNSDIVISALPLAFDYGLYQMILSFSVGATLVLEKDFTWPLLFSRKIAEVKATVLPVVPSMLALLHDVFSKKKQDFSSIRIVTNTGAALTPKHVDMARKLFSSAQIFSMYGLTECKRCTYLPPKDIERKAGSIGIAIPNTELWIVDENHQKLEPGKIGQLVIRGATVMKGYWNKPEETEKKLKNGPLPTEKVLYTGDYAELDHEGYLYFRGRMDEMIKCRGIKVSPKEVEDIISRQEHVKEVAVVGVEDVEYGTAVWAFVSPMDDKTFNLNELYHYCETKLSKEKFPARIELMQSLPKTQNGKLNKKALEAQASLMKQGKNHASH